MNRIRLLHLANVAAFLGLIALCVAWELWLAPLRPGGSWLVLKVLPLLAALRGILHARNYTLKWSTLMILIYVTEGLVRSYTDQGLSRQLAALELGLALICFGTAIGLVRAARSGTHTAN